MPRFCSALLLVVVCASAASADVVHLTDGRRVEGKVTQSGGTVLVETPMGPIRYPAGLVERIERSPAAPADAGKPALPDSLTAGDRTLYNEASSEADRVQTAAEGLAIWNSAVAKIKDARILADAREQRSTWDTRVKLDQVRFGPQWLAREEAHRRSAEADELLKAADATPDLGIAGELYDKAARAHPFREDIPFAKAMRLIKADRSAEAVGIYTGVLRGNPDHAAALNNLGVLSAMQKNWDRALVQLLKAAETGRTDRMFDNLELAMWQADGDGYPPGKLEATDRKMRTIVSQMHAAGERVDQNRWGNGWIAQKQYETYMAENRDSQKKLSDTRNEMDKLETDYTKATKARDDLRDELRRRFFTSGRGWGQTDDARGKVIRLREMSSEIDKMEERAGTLESQESRLEQTRHKPPVASQYVLVDVTGRQAAHQLAPPTTAADEAKAREEANKQDNDDGGDNRRRRPWGRRRN